MSYARDKQPDNESVARLIHYQEALFREPDESFSEGVSASSADLPRDAAAWLRIFERVRRSRCRASGATSGPIESDASGAAAASSHAAAGTTPERTEPREPTQPGEAVAPAACTDPIAPAESSAPIAPDEPGGSVAPAKRVEKLGRFEVLRVLGRGGCGIVFLARDPRLGRQVALKVPRPESLVDAELRRRFLQEGEAAAGLKHPHIVPIYEAGQIGPVCYLAQEYCEGGTLAQWLGRLQKPLAPRVAAELVAQLASAVHFAHSRGVLHRDLKPGNILLEPNAPVTSLAHARGVARLGFTAKIADFGLAKLVDSGGHATTQGLVIGTPAYMAPEQAQGKPQDAGTHTDVYALGVILFELLTGRPPIVGDSDVETLVRVAVEEPVFPSQWKRRLPRDLQAVCLKCLQKNPEARYASAAALADDLQRFVTGRPTEAHPPGYLGLIVKWCRRRPSVAALVLVSALATAGLLAGGWWHATRLGSALRIAENQRAEAIQQRMVADAMRRKAMLSEQRIRHGVYATHIRIAHKALSRGDLGWAIQSLEQCQSPEDRADLREFVWRYLWRKCHAHRNVLRGHKADVYHVAFSHDGSRLATAGKDGTLRLWNPISGELLATLRGHRGEVNAVQFAPDGTTLATASDDGSVMLWNTATARHRATLTGHRGVVVALAFAPDGETLVSGGEDGAVRLWSVSAAAPSAVLADGLDWIEAVGFSPDGRTLGVCSRGAGVQLWDVATGQVRHAFVDRGASATCLAFSHDGKRLAVGAVNSAVTVWDTTTGQKLLTCLGHTDAVQSVVFSPDDRTLFSGGKDTSLRIWEVQSGRALGVLPAHTGRVWCVALSPNGHMLATASRDGTTKLWNVPPDGRIGGVATVRTGFSEALASLPGGGDRLLASDAISTAALWRLVDARFGFGHGFAHAQAVLAFSTDRSVGEIRLQNQMTPELSRLFNRRVDRVRAIVCSPDGRQVATAGMDGTIQLWDPVTRRIYRELAVPNDSVRFLAFSSDSKILASAGTDCCVRYWNAQSGAPLGSTPPWGSPTVCAVSSPCQPLLATAFADGQIALWQFDRNQPTLQWRGHLAGVKSVAFSPNGTTLVGGSLDGRLRLWDVRSGQELMAIDTELAHIYCVAFSHDGTLLAASGQTSTGNDAMQLFAAP